MSSQTFFIDDTTENLVEVRRSSGKKEWVSRETLAELNKNRRLKRASLRAKNDDFLTQRKPKKPNWIAISIWLNVLLLTALLVALLP